MGNRGIKQEARRAALDAQTRRQEERAERERRLGRLAIQVLVAIREREAAMLDADRRAGKALTEMIETERLSARDAAQWCGDEVTAREVARLRRAVADANTSTSKGESGGGLAASATAGAATEAPTDTDAAAS